MNKKTKDALNLEHGSICREVKIELPNYGSRLKDLVDEIQYVESDLVKWSGNKSVIIQTFKDMIVISNHLVLNRFVYSALKKSILEEKDLESRLNRRKNAIHSANLSVHHNLRTINELENAIKKNESKLECLVKRKEKVNPESIQENTDVELPKMLQYISGLNIKISNIEGIIEEKKTLLKETQRILLEKQKLLKEESFS